MTRKVDPNVLIDNFLSKNLNLCQNPSNPADSHSKPAASLPPSVELSETLATVRTVSTVQDSSGVNSIKEKESGNKNADKNQ